MNTKHIPVMIALIAGLFTCVISFFRHTGMEKFVITLCLVVLIFFCLGGIIKKILDKNFQSKEEAEEQEEQTLESEEVRRPEEEEE